MKKLAFEELEKRVDKFVSEDAAKRFANRSKKIKMIILGEDNKYWIGYPAVTEQLRKMGYEYV